MKKLCAFLMVPVLAGCLTAHMPTISYWNIVADPCASSSSQNATYGVTRLTQVVVCAPYDEPTMTVYRDDNTFVEDPFNIFAAVPSRLLKEPTRELLENSGRFKTVVGPSSSATTSHIAELIVKDFYLDCSHDEAHPDRREAVIDVVLLVLDGNRDIVGIARGGARSDAREGDYGRSFSKAFSDAVKTALAHL